MMKKIGIAGYMGAGKSTAARFLQASACVVIDADREAKLLMSSDRRIRDSLMREFGPSITTGPEINFSVLGDLAFATVDGMKRLNACVHPLLLERLKRMFVADEARVRVLDAALIPMWGIESWFDALVWIRSSPQLRLQRLRSKSPLSEAVLRTRMSVQESFFREPSAGAWTIIDNEGTADGLKQAIETWWRANSQPQ
jgi:dephospho-CoA kinase